MKLITAEELIAAPNGTVFTYLPYATLIPNSILRKIGISFNRENIYVDNLAYGEERISTLFIMKDEYRYFMYETNDLIAVIQTLQQALDS